MARYKCINPECENYNKISDDLAVWNKYSDGKVVDMNLECSGCNQDRILVTPNKDKGICTAMHGDGNLCNK